MQVQPAVKDAASRAEPAAKDVTQNYIRPAGDYVADNAVPLTKEIGEFSRVPRSPICQLQELCSIWTFAEILQNICEEGSADVNGM